MAYDLFMVAPYNSGLQNDLRPFLIPDDAFTNLNNAYVFRGRVRKRFGSTYTGTNGQLSSRLRINVGTTDVVTGNLNGTVPGSVFTRGQMFSIGTEIFTVQTDDPLLNPIDIIHTGATVTATYDITNGNFVFVGATPNTIVYFYPATPVMGIEQYQIGPINNQPTYAFDTQFAYLYTGGAWLKVGPSAGNQWHGTDSQFFWATTWTGVTPGSSAFFVSNFNATLGVPGANDDTMWWYDGANWTTFTPQYLAAGNKVITARLIVPFKDRLVLLNTIEQNAAGNLNTSYKSRCRYSINGSPLVGAASVYPTSWLEPNQVGASGAGYVDAATDEQIVSAEFIKDRLIVYFEKSTWELAYTGNQVLPFVWQKLNTELGSQSTLSSVPFDKMVFTIGSTGVHACNGSNVERVDSKIPDQIFLINNNNDGVHRVAGIRDYYTEMVYWTYPSDNQTQNQNYPNKLLVYNYKNESWATNDDSITAFGYFDGQQGATWASTQEAWEEMNMTWAGGPTSLEFRQIVAGNQQGFIFIVSPDVSSNAAVLEISLAFSWAQPNTIFMQIVNHNLTIGDWIKVTGLGGCVITDKDGNVVTDFICQVIDVIGANNIKIGGFNAVGIYQGGGLAARVSNIQISTKQMNPYRKQGKSVYLAKIDFYVLRTSVGQITVDYKPSSSGLSMLNEATQTNALTGNGILETNPYALIPLEATQTFLWHPVYFGADGDSIQLKLYLSDQQISTVAIAESNFELEAMVLYTMPVSRLQ